MSHLVAASAPIASAHAVKLYPGFGILGADIPASGEHGASPALNDNLLPGSEYYWRLEAASASGTVTIYPDLTFSHTGAADGTWTWQYRLFEDRVDQGVATVTDVFAAVVSLIIASARHGHLADNLTLGASGSTSLSVQEATHAHTADNLPLSTAAYLAIADAIHAHLADNLSLSTDSSASLAIADALHSLASDALVLSLPSAPGTCPTAAEIAAAVLAAAQVTPIHSDIIKVNNHSVNGSGTDGDPWGPV